MELELLLRLRRQTAARELLQDVFQHRLAERRHRVAFLAKMETQIEVVLRLQLLVDTEILRQLLAAVVDQRANHSQAEVGSPRGRIEVPGALSDQGDGKEIATVGSDQVVLPQELQVGGDLLPLVRRAAGFQLAGLLVDLLAQRLGVDSTDKVQKGHVVRVLALEEGEEPRHGALEVLATRLLRKLLKDRVHTAGDVEVLRIDQLLEELLDTCRYPAQGRLGRLTDAEALVLEGRKDRRGDLGPVRTPQPIEDVDVDREVRRLAQQIDELRQALCRQLDSTKPFQRQLRDVLPVVVAKELLEEPDLIRAHGELGEESVHGPESVATHLGKVLAVDEVPQHLVRLLSQPRSAETAQQKQPSSVNVWTARVGLALHEPVHGRKDRALLPRLHVTQGLAEARRDVLRELERLLAQALEERLEGRTAVDRRHRRDDRPLAVEIGLLVECLQLRRHRGTDGGDDDHRVVPDDARGQDQWHHEIRHITRPQPRESLEGNELHLLAGLAQTAAEGPDHDGRRDPDLRQNPDCRDPQLDVAGIEKGDELLDRSVHISGRAPA